ncbi:hypothetical protein BJF93_16410 [Xaviernesmea oryzae]|uniref:Nudix hydrolase domain-containing protein n=1 Tax=Xaviernesmea oryzae TaxID=464029 RepID=A0A1Q9ATU6_9HYPH|nr:hypothetical protein BJF93_16410 [Xaviernesmea oryzae]
MDLPLSRALGPPPDAQRAARRLRPRDAASLLLIDRSRDTPRLLLGRRAGRHAFMPGLFVFPGGRRDAADLRHPVAAGLPHPVERRLMAGLGRRASPALARALAVAALRELQEEAGLSIGRPLSGPSATLPRSQAPALSSKSGTSAGKVIRNQPSALSFLPDAANLRYIARAVTPPGHVRRYDTHFFALFADEAGIDTAATRDSLELEELQWIALNQALSVPPPVPMADITRAILSEMARRLLADPDLARDMPVPFYHSRRGCVVRDLM